MRDNLQDALKKAKAEVEQAGIIDVELKKIAFSKAVDFYLWGETTPGSIHENVGSVVKDGSNFFSVLASAAGIEEKKLKDVYSLKNGKQILLVISSVPGKSKADQQRNLAALILFAYQEGLNHEWVSSALVAEAARHSKLYDTSKFAKNLQCRWFRTEGVKKGLKYKLSGPGTTETKSILGEIT